MPGFSLRLGGDRQNVLGADRGDEVRLDLYLMCGGECLALLFHDLVAFRDPVIPEADRNLAGGPSGPNMHKRKGCRSSANFSARRRDTLVA